MSVASLPPWQNVVTFNQPILSWDVSSVTTMSYMFDVRRGLPWFGWVMSLWMACAIC